MNTDNAKSILSNYQLRPTACRMQVLAYFLEKNCAIAHTELEQEMADFDRVTIYRTLNTFEEKGLVHKVVDGSNSTKYAVCSDSCDAHQHHDEHIHFSCIKCGVTECLDHVSIPQIKLPQDYQYIAANYLIQGHCPKCAS